MEWITPKTDWAARTDDKGRYAGDYFNIADYNRIKNNIWCLRDMAVKLYQAFQIADMGMDKGLADYLYADEINLIEDNLDTISASTFHKSYGEKQVFTDNGTFIDYAELNRIESATLDIYDKLTSQHEGRRMLTFMLGSREVL